MLIAVIMIEIYVSFINSVTNTDSHLKGELLLSVIYQDLICFHSNG